MTTRFCKLALATGVAIQLTAAACCLAAKPTVTQALKLAPIQKEVDYDRPDAQQEKKCTLVAESSSGAAGWVVRAESSQLLRRFLDTNKDNKVDQWCYFKNGIEIYRDIDANFNGKADQYRWLGTAGIRWGFDRDEDGRVDEWKIISPEEVTAEIVHALRTRDAARFSRLLLSSSDLKQLQLGPQQTKQLAEKTERARKEFAALARRQTVVTAKTQWVHFGGTQPGVVPAGTEGSKKDLIVYDNVAAMVETEGKYGQVQIGTLVQVAQGWRVIDLPQNLSDSQANQAGTGYFFQASFTPRVPLEKNAAGEGISQEIQELISRLEQVDKDLASVSNNQPRLASLNARRADILEQLAKTAHSPQERGVWVRQFADTVSAAVQSGGFPDGVQRLQDLKQQLEKDAADKDHVAYVEFRLLTAQYGLKLQDPKADFAKIQQDWLESLQAFVEQHPKSEDAAEAMLQLAVGKEFAGQEDDATQWYATIIRDFPSSSVAGKAAGAKRRIESVGKAITLKGTTLDGKTVDLAKYRGKTVLIHYWATWCQPCQQDLQVIKAMQAKYGRRGFTPIGISLDSQRSALTDYLKQHRLPWPQLYEQGGLDSRLANELGILTLPTMLLIDRTGKVVNRSIHAGELDAELGKLLR